MKNLRSMYISSVALSAMVNFVALPKDKYATMMADIYAGPFVNAPSMVNLSGGSSAAAVAAVKLRLQRIVALMTPAKGQSVATDTNESEGIVTPPVLSHISAAVRDFITAELNAIVNTIT